MSLRRFYDNHFPFLFLALLLAWTGFLVFVPAHPPIGTYVVIIGLIVAMVTFWEPEKRRSKAVWMVTFTLLAYLEIHNLYRDKESTERQRNANEAKRQEQFQATVGRLDTIFREQRGNFSTTMTRLDDIKHSSPSRSLVSVRRDLRADSAAPDSGLRKRTLNLAKDILEFLSKREQGDPSSETNSNVFMTSPDNTSSSAMTSPYMRQTLAKFDDEFASRLADIHDELSSRGVRVPELDELYKNPGRTFAGNINYGINELADSLQSASLLLPPENMYREKSDSQIATMGIEEANKMIDMTNQAMADLMAHGKDQASARAIRERFANDSIQCCLTEVRTLRTLMLERLGYSGNDASEMNSFQFSIADFEKHPSASIAAILDYAPRFLELARKLNLKARQ